MSEAANVDDDPITVPKWKLVCLLNALLKTEDPDVHHKKSHKQTQQRKTTEKSAQKAVESFQKPHALGWENDSFHAMSFMARVLNVATQLSTTHRWDGNAKLFSALARQISHCPVVIWKVGAQCLSNHPDGRDDLLRSFAKTMVQVGRTAAPEILFDYTTRLISIGEYQEAKQFLEEYKVKCGHRISQDVRVILQGFRGMLEYIEWFQKKKAKDDDGDIPGNQLAAIGIETEIAVHADRAIAHFNKFEGCQENCDSFMSILIEILEYYNRIDELEKVLQSYLQFNETHPSPCIFMYEFLMKHYPTDVERQSYILEELTRICPSHPYILDLCKLFSEQEFIKSVQHLSCLVDYEEWRNSLQIWKQLALTLITSAIHCKDKSQYHTLHTLWTDRSMWWPAYHFRLEGISVHDQTSAELCMFKAIVIATMFNSEHAYIMMVKEQLEVGKWENELSYLIMKLEIADHLNQQVKNRLAEKCRNLAATQLIPPALDAPVERRLPQLFAVPALTTQQSKNFCQQRIVKPPHNNWKITKKPKKSAAEFPQERKKVHNLIIKKCRKTKLDPLNRRGRPKLNTIGNSVSSSSLSTTSSTTSSDEDDSSLLRQMIKGKQTSLQSTSTGISQTFQPLGQKFKQTKVLRTANGTILKNQAIRRSKIPPYISKPQIYSSDTDSDSDDVPLANGMQCNQKNAKMKSATARAAVPLKRKSNVTSANANLQSTKKSHPSQTFTGQAGNFSPTRTWSWRKTLSDKLTQNLVKGVDSNNDARPKQGSGNVPAQFTTREADLAAASNQNLTRKKNGVSSTTVNSDKHVFNKADAQSKRTRKNASGVSRVKGGEQAPKSATMATDILPAECSDILHHDDSKDASDHSPGTNDRPIKLELVVPSTDSEIEEQGEQISHTMKWKGKSLTLSAPVKLKDVAVVLERIKMENF